ncbi:unnamed protein product, partial [Leptidea sinapis]
MNVRVIYIIIITITNIISCFVNYQENFYTGRVFGESLSDVKMHIDNGVITGIIHTPDETYHIEPSWRHLPHSDDKTMITYRSSDIRYSWSGSKADKPRVCGYVKEGKELEEAGDEEGEDLETIQEQSEKDKYLDQTVNTDQPLSTQDSSNVKANTRSGKRVKRQSDYEYTPTKTRCPLLLVFSREYSHKDFCLAHLFTDLKFEGGILGLAYVGSPRRNSVGGICTPVLWGGNNGYTLYLNSGLSSSRNHYGQRVITREADLVTAHEFGHNWGSEHDPDVAEKVLQAKSGRCFSEPEESFCGNLRVEGGEECDAGLDKNSPCCAGCVFAPPGVVCREAAHSACEGEATCNGATADCPKAPAIADEHECAERGRCRNGSCVPYCETQGMHSCMCDVVERFWDIIEDININNVLGFLRDNIVGVVVLATAFLWIPASCVISYVDRRRQRLHQKYAEWERHHDLITKSKAKHKNSDTRKQSAITSDSIYFKLPFLLICNRISITNKKIIITIISGQGKKENYRLLAKLNKQIKENMKKDRKKKRLQTLERYIQNL